MKIKNNISPNVITKPDWSSANGYPTAFEGLLQNDDERLGYKDRRTGYPNHISGWYAEGGRMQYDFQDNLITNPVGLVLESKDVFDNRSTIEYDEYQLLPVNTKQYLNATDFLETKAEYDYRTFQANKVTDPNDNISVFDFSPLGLLKATAVIGKGTEGDYKSSTGNFYDRYAPSVQMEYDFFAFKNEGNPVWVKTIQREQHYQDEENSPTILKVEYSDGFGRLLQTRAQAEDVIFGNQTFGTSGLSADQNAQNSSAVGVERAPQNPLNVVVSGWKIYNNKGKVVEQYEPFFDKGFDYVLPQLSTTGGTIAPQLGVKVKMYYDPLQRVVKTVNPDGSQQRVIYGIPNALDTPNIFAPTPWEQYTYDANDLAPLTNPNNNTVPASHYYTPKSALMDALGRTIQTTEHKAHYNADTAVYEDVVMKYLYDIRGNLLEVRDPYNRKVFEHIYDLRPTQESGNGQQQSLPPLWTKHIDAGISNVFYDTAGRIFEATDAKGASTLNAYDNGSRPIRFWAKDKTEENVTLRQVIEYGDAAGLNTPENENLKGQFYKYYDEAGLVEIPKYDFKGNTLKSLRRVISDEEILSVLGNSVVHCYRVDWTGLNLSILDTKVYETDSEYDALNRITKILYPEDVDNERKELTPIYNRSGVLESVKMNGQEYVKYIAYNAKGQRLLIALGNGVMTRYCYDIKRFRLMRYRSETFSKSGWTFSGTGSIKQDLLNEYDLIGNITDIHENVTACGIGGTNSLDREFNYDPLYRLLSANGREKSPTITPIWDDRYRSTDNSTTTAYTQHYLYNKLGNIQHLQHIGNNDFTRHFNYNINNNRLQSIDIGQTNYEFAYDNCGNQTQETVSRFFEWDATNRLRSFYVFDGSNISQYTHYLYDSGGNRIKKLTWKQGGNYISLTYSNSAFEYMTDGTNEQNLLHVMDDQSRIASVRLGDNFDDSTPAIKYNLEDHLNSSVLLLGENGSNINREEYYPFGETSFGSYAKKRYKYSGKERDEESGLYYYGARYYSAWICKFISCDPLSGNFPWQSAYVAFDNNPIIYVDLFGLASQGNGEVNGNQPTRQEEKAMDKYEKFARKQGYKPENLTPEDRDVIWEQIKDKPWAWVQQSYANKDRVDPNDLNSYQRVDELHYAYRSKEYSTPIDKTLTIKNYTWVPDDTLTVEPPGIPDGAPWSIRETTQIDLNRFIPSGATVENATVTITRLPGAASDEEVTVSDASGILSSKLLSVENSLTVDVSESTFTISTNRTTDNGIGMGPNFDMKSWPWYNVKITINYTVLKNIPQSPSVYQGGNKANFLKDLKQGKYDKNMTPWVKR